MSSLSKRVSILEARHSSKRKPYIFWAMDPNSGEPMTQAMIDAEIARIVAQGNASASERFIPVCWLPIQDPAIVQHVR
jgi:hypothetical protein